MTDNSIIGEIVKYCPIMSGPVEVTKHNYTTYELFKAPCMGQRCAFSYIHHKGVGKPGSLYCRYHLSVGCDDILIGEIDE